MSGRRGAVRMVGLFLALLAPACSDDGTGPSVATDSLHLSLDSVRLWVGDTVRLSAEVRRADGTVEAADVQWSTTTPAVEVGSSGRVRGVARGRGTIRATAAGLHAEIPATSLPVIRARIHAVGGGPLDGLEATWRSTDGENTDTGPVGADGALEIRAATLDSLGELLIDGTPPRTFHPFLYPFHVDSLADVDVLMVPRRWTVARGIYAGQVVETPLDPVMDDDADQLFFTYFLARAEPRSAPTLYRVDLMAWLETRFPARVAFDHRHGSSEFTPDDSVAIWGALDRMEEVFGMNLFEPVEADPEWWPDPPEDDLGLVPGVIRVVYEPPTWRGAPLSEEEPVTWERELGEWASEGRFSAFRVSRRTLDGGALLVGALEPLQLADGLIPWETVLMHETLHVLGVGHTCRVPSPQGPCVRTPEPSPHDVAYMELLREAVRLGEGLGTFLGLMPATIGERRVILGTSALPELVP